MKQHKCIFKDTEAAAKHNSKWLKHYHWDLERAIEHQKGTMLETGSEFRQAETIQPLF